MMNKHYPIYLGLVISSVLTFILVPQNSIARMYKWVDEDGNTQYTQSPPPGDIESEVIKPPPKVDTEAAEKGK